MPQTKRPASGNTPQSGKNPAKSTASGNRSGKNKVYVNNARDAKRQSAGRSGSNGSSARSSGSGKASSPRGNAAPSRSGARSSAGSKAASARTSGTGLARSGSASARSASGSARSNPAPSRRTAGSARSNPASSRSGSASARSSQGSSARTAPGRSASRRPSGNAEYQETLKLTLDKDDNLRDEIALILTLLACVLVFLSYIGMCGSFGNIVNTVVFGLFGRFGYVFPFVTFLVVLFAISNKKNATIISKIVYCVLMMINISALIQLIARDFDKDLKLTDYFTKSLLTYTEADKTFGGFFGGALCKLICPFLGRVATIIVFVAFILVLFILLLGRAIFTAITRKTGDGLSAYHERRQNMREEARIRREEDELARRESLAERKRRVMEARQEQDEYEADELVSDEEYQDILENEYNDDDIIDELIRISSERLEQAQDEDPPKEKFVDTLMKRGKGLDISRVKDTPEYRMIKSKYGLTDHEMSELITGTAAEKEQSAAYPDSSSASEHMPDSPASPKDLVQSELEQKFGSKSTQEQAEKTGIQIIKLRPRTDADKNSPRNYFIDEDPDESKVVAFDRYRDKDHSEEAANPARMPETLLSDDTAVPDEAPSFGEITVPDEATASDETGARDEIPASQADDYEHDHPRTPSSRRKSAVKDSAGKDNLDKDTVAGSDRTSSNSASFNSPEEIAAAMAAAEEARKNRPYEFPPVSLLNKSEKAKAVDQAELNETVEKLQSTFESFGVRVNVKDATCGPTVTRYELYPEQGVKVKTITSLTDDIKLALAAQDIRIEAPIPGKAAVGIEVPNKVTTPVSLRDLIDSPEFKDSKSNLTFAVGKDIGGKTICFDIASMPHMLIAGSTGSGKSVCINALILSIMYKAKPSDVRMIMVDPKRVELVGYNGIPHLLVPVVTDVKKASGALNWAIAEMDDRYQRFADAGVNNLKSYNRLMEEQYYEEGNEGECPNRLPQILIIIDELNDLMMTANSKEVEASIARLTQLARACGIHVVLATQRPSVNVITGTIKANIPSRIAFAVSSFVDSKTILDQGGAERLLGKGDMLFYPQGYPQPVRLQGAYVSDKEIASVVKFIKDQCEEVKYSDRVREHIENNAAADTSKSSGSSSSSSSAPADRDDDLDELYEEAARCIIESKKASVGMLQRKFRIGFNRAARIMDKLAEDEVVGPEEGTKPRRILMTLEQFEAFLNGGTAAPPEDSVPDETDADPEQETADD